MSLSKSKCSYSNNGTARIRHQCMKTAVLSWHRCLTNNGIQTIGLYHPLDGITILKYKLLCFWTPDKKIFKAKGASF
jgi:hypothetical protein